MNHILDHDQWPVTPADTVSTGCYSRLSVSPLPTWVPRPRHGRLSTLCRRAFIMNSMNKYSLTTCRIEFLDPSTLRKVTRLSRAALTMIRFIHPTSSLNTGHSLYLSPQITGPDHDDDRVWPLLQHQALESAAGHSGRYLRGVSCPGWQGAQLWQVACPHHEQILQRWPGSAPGHQCLTWCRVV